MSLLSHCISASSGAILSFCASFGRHLSTHTGSVKKRVCIVGSGPSGCYSADKVMKRYGDTIEVDLLDRLPTPFGLVRSGVAPDHPDTKNVINQFSEVLKDPRLRFFGNVKVGTDLSLAELRKLYDAVILCYGAESDRKLRIPGEEGPSGVLSAREFVWWYNGHPDARRLPVDLANVESVAICGVGNVALDCARLLLRRPSELSSTDVAAHALQQLTHRSRVREVHLVARRGPVQAACTPKELKELLNIGGMSVQTPSSQLMISPSDEEEMKTSRMKRRLYELLKGTAVDEGEIRERGGGGERGGLLRFQFYRNPVEVIRNSRDQVEGLKVERTALQAVEGRGTVAVGTGQYDLLPVQLILTSIGYKSLPLDGLPFDQARGVVPNIGGRVIEEGGAGSSVIPGLYVCGWLKRGPTGIIGTNLVDAEETTSALIQDDPKISPHQDSTQLGRGGLEALLHSKGVRYVTLTDWQRLDERELESGRKAQKSREKVTDLEEMVNICLSKS